MLIKIIMNYYYCIRIIQINALNVFIVNKYLLGFLFIEIDLDIDNKIMVFSSTLSFFLLFFYFFFCNNHIY